MIWTNLDLPRADVRILRSAVPPTIADQLYDRLLFETPWRRDALRFGGGQARSIPRSHAWVSNTGTAYSWSGLTMIPTPIGSAVLECLEIVQRATGATFDGVLANHYADGFESCGWHADDENTMGATIASLSFGATRAFHLRRKRRKGEKRAGVDVVRIDLHAGDLLVMAGTTQEHWEHSLPKAARATRPRINLTFRQLTEKS